MSYAFSDELRARIAANLAAHPRESAATEGLKRAAVAFAVTAAGAEAAFVLTKRATRMNRHSGQWALPGGRVDAGESVEEAALREMAEEVSLELGPEAVLGRLDDYPTRSGYLISPVVVWAGAAEEMTPNPAEVARIHRVHLAELDRPDSPQFVEIPESDRPVIRMPILHTHIHAPTAAVLYQAREVCLHGRATRVAALEQPVWAWS
jgi:8-oxo-dGTP pyrophosphatase MutT (NUDIX family)